MHTFWQGFEKRAIQMSTVIELVSKRLAQNTGKSKAAVGSLAEEIVESYAKKHPGQAGQWWKKVDNYSDITAFKKDTKGDADLAEKMLDWFRNEVSL